MVTLNSNNNKEEEEGGHQLRFISFTCQVKQIGFYLSIFSPLFPSCSGYLTGPTHEELFIWYRLSVKMMGGNFVHNNVFCGEMLL